MRRRVLPPLIVFGIVMVLALLIPASHGIAVSRTQQLELQRSASVEQITLLAGEALASGDAQSLNRYLEQFWAAYGEAVLVTSSAGEPIAAVGTLAADVPIESLVQSATRLTPQRSIPTVMPWSGEVHTIAAPVASAAGVVSGVVLLQVDLTAARADVTFWWIGVWLLALVVLALLLVASLVWTEWIVRPVRELDAAANALAEQRAPALEGVKGPPELRQLAASFTRMSGSMREALEQQRGFVAEASHQLRNPLAAIRLRVDGLAATSSDDESIAAVDGDLNRLERVVDRMLVLANAEHRATSALSAPTEPGLHPDAGRCVLAAASLAAPHRAALRAAGVQLRVLDDADVELVARAHDVEEIVEILLDNARKYAGAGATVSVSLRPQAGGALLEISDNGPGVADEELAYLGERFWRSPEQQSLPGTGLGLAIAAQLARANHGELRFDRSPEGGLRARVELGAP